MTIQRNSASTFGPGNSSRAFVLSSLLVVSVLLSLPQLASSEVTSIGPGVAGQIHALAYHPADSLTIYAGGDNCGVYKTVDGGNHWSLWNDGLENMNFTLSFYVDDFIVVDEDSSAAETDWQIYAATHGGIYKRQLDGNFEWELKTGGFAYKGGYLDKFGGPVPFSSFAFDTLSGTLFAGAGHSRFKENAANWRDYYPGIETSVEYPGSEGPNGQYSLWKINIWEENSSWTSVGNSSGHGIVTDVTVVYNQPVGEVSPQSRTIYSTRSGIYIFKEITSEVTDLTVNAEKSGFWPGHFWSVGAGYGGRLYIESQRLDDPDLEPSIHYFDIFDEQGDYAVTSTPIDPVFLDSLVPGEEVYPTGKNWVEIITDIPDPINPRYSDFTTMTVVSGPARGEDEVFVGGRRGISPDGYFRYGEYQRGDLPTKWGWIKIHGREKVDNINEYWTLDYSNGDVENPARQSNFDPGWLTDYQIYSTVELIQHGKFPGNMFVMDCHFPMATSDSGSTWVQKNCTYAEGGWQSNGLNLMGARDSGFDSDGGLLIGAGDFGLFHETSRGSKAFNFLTDTDSTGTNDVYKLDVYDNGDCDLVFVVKDHSVGELARKSNTVIGVCSLCESPSPSWEFISYEIKNTFEVAESRTLNTYSIADIVVVSPESLFATCNYSIVNANADSSFSRSSLLHGTSDGGSWSWTIWGNVHLDLGPFFELATIPGTTRLLVSATEGSGKYGGLFCYDILDSSHFVPWIVAQHGGSDLQRSVDNVLALSVSRFGECVYLGTAGQYQQTHASDFFGTVIRIDGPFDGGVPDFEEKWKILCNGTGENQFAFEFPDQFLTGVDWGTGVLNAGQSFTDVRDIAIDPSNPHVIYAGLSSSGLSNGAIHPKMGVWIGVPTSLPGQYTWDQLLGGEGDGVPAKGIATLALDKNNPDFLYAGYYGQEFFKVGITPTTPPDITISDRAIYAIPNNGGDMAVFAVDVNVSVPVDSVASIFVNAKAIGGPLRVALNDTAGAGDRFVGDGIWSVELGVLDPAPAVGEYLLPVVARNQNWDTVVESVLIQVVEPMVSRMVDVSNLTGDLKDLGGQPYSAVTINVGDSLSTLTTWGEEDLVISMLDANIRVRKAYGFAPDDLNVKNFVSDLIAFQDGQIPEDRYRGLAVADFDNDGYEDLFASHESNPRLYRWDPSKNCFVDWTSAIDVLYESIATATWGDFNQDGWVDLFVGLDMYSYPPPPGSLSTLYSGPINRGYGQLLINQSGNLVWDMDYMNEFYANCFTASWVDVDRDGDQDLFVGDYWGDDEHPTTRIYENQGFNEGYSLLPDSLVVDNFGHLLAADFADVDNDGDFDLVCASENGPANISIHENDFDSAQQAFPSWNQVVNEDIWLPAIEEGLNGLLTADFDLNGYVDILTLPHLNGTTPELLLNGLSTVAGVFARSKAFTSMEAGVLYGGLAHDWNDDGDLDLFMGRVPSTTGAPATNFFYQNRSSAPNTAETLSGVDYVKVRLLRPSMGNVTAIGSTVEILSNGELVGPAQQVSGGEGRGGQRSRVLTFGLTSEPDSIRVTWPDGFVEMFSVTSAESNYILSDSREPQLDGNSVVATIALRPGKIDWTFEWESNIPLTDIEVVFRPNPIYPEYDLCLCGHALGEEIVLNAEAPHVQTNAVLIEAGRYRYSLQWTDDWCCSPNCGYQYRVSGKNGPTTYGDDESDWRTAKAPRSCIGNF